jgi:Tfp pilus assembly protein PilF
MADRRAAPLLEKLKANPTDAAAFSQLGALYGSAHQFPQSAEYYRKALECDPQESGHSHATGLQSLLRRRCG